MANRRQRCDTGQKRQCKTFKWSDDMRVFLHVLHSDFSYTRSLNAIIFRSAFVDDVRRHGATNDRLEVLITAQICERNQMRAKIWIDVCRTSLSSTEVARRERFRNMIRNTAASIKSQSTCRTHLRSETPLQPSRSGDQALGAESNDQYGKGIRRPIRASTIPSEHATPLSKRPPIATWAPNVSINHNEDQLSTPSPKKRRVKTLRGTARQLVPVVSRREISPQRSLMTTSTSPPTLRKKQSRASLQSQKVQVTQTHGTTINITPIKLAQITKDLVPISEQQAHPLMGGLLFRYWAEDDSSGHNSETGFIARKYTNRVNFNQAPPHCTTLDWHDLFYHIDRIGIQQEFQSPFISVSNSLIWTVRLALKEGEEDPAKWGRISVINVDGLVRRSLYYVPPYHKEMKKSFEFTSGSWRYAGTHEFIVWKEIPRKAIIHTFSVKDLMRLVRNSETLRRALRFDMINARDDLKSKIMPALRQRKVGLTAELTGGFARLAGLIGFSTHSSIEQLSNLICELCQGWGINLVRQTDEQWSHLSRTFSNALFAADDKQPNIREETCIRRGFLDGVAFASSSHFNTRHSAETIRLMYKRAQSIGLSDPGKIIMEEFAAAQLAVMMFEKRQQRALPGYKTQLLLEGPAYDEGFASADDAQDDDDYEGETVVAQPVLRARAARTRMMEEDEATVSDDEEMISFEYGKDGLLL